MSPPIVIPSYERELIGAVPSEPRRVLLGPWEQEYSRASLLHKSSSALFAGLTLECPLDFIREQLPIALRTLQKRHPTLRCRLGKLNKKHVYEEDPNLVIRVDIRARHGDPQTWHKVWYDEFEGRETVLGESCLKVLLFADFDNDEECELVLVVNHNVTDGTGMAFLFHELLQFLSSKTTEEQVEWGRWETPVDEAKVLHSKYPRTNASRMQKSAEMWKTIYRAGKAGGVRPLPFARGHRGMQLLRTPTSMINNAKTHMLARYYEEHEVELLLKKCRAEKTTVTGAVTAAFVSAQQEAVKILLFAGSKQDDDERGVAVTMFASLRASCGVSNENLAPHLSLLPFSVCVKNGDLWQAARDVVSTLKRIGEEDRLWYGKHVTKLMKLVPIGQNLVTLPSLTVTSWGSNAVKRKYEGIKVKRSLFAQASRQSPMPIVSCNNMLDGTLNLLYFTPTPRFSAQLATDIFERAVANLAAMMQQDSKPVAIQQETV